MSNTLISLIKPSDILKLYCFKDSIFCIINLLLMSFVLIDTGINTWPIWRLSICQPSLFVCILSLWKENFTITLSIKLFPWFEFHLHPVVQGHLHSDESCYDNLFLPCRAWDVFSRVWNCQKAECCSYCGYSIHVQRVNAQFHTERAS